MSSVVVESSKKKRSRRLTKKDMEVIEDARRIIEYNRPKDHRTIFIVILIVISTIAIFALVFSTIFAVQNITSDKIIQGVSVLNVDVSKLTKDEARKKLNDELGIRLTTDLVFKHNDHTYTLLPSEIKADFNIDDLVNEAYSVGRTGTLFENNYSILSHFRSNENILPKLNLDNDLMYTLVPQIEEQFDDGVVQPTYSIEGTNLIIYAGKNGYKVNFSEFKKEISKKLLSEEYNNNPIIIPVDLHECESIDIDKIYSEVYVDAIDATYTTNPYNITPSRNGWDFAISIDDAKKIITGNQETYTIPLKILYPAYTTADIGMDAFPDMISSYSTNYGSSNYNRSTNIALATSKINGVVLMPGEEFSYNGTVGQRTRANGFLEAGAYSDGQVITAVGGGICQVSSTLYNAVLRANLEVTDRTNHMFPVSYCPIGTDATVSWGAPDFKFKNNRQYPIKIVAYTSNKNCYVSIYGLWQNDDYDITVYSYKTGTNTSITYKIFKHNGEEVKREAVSWDYYMSH